jgi:hypothetical protein
MGTENLGITTESRVAENFFAGDHPRVQVVVVIVSGQSDILAKGTVLGRITATGKYTPYTSGASDGSQTAKLILAEDIDATEEDANAVCYAHGEFNEAALTGISVAATAQLREVGIYVKEVK